MLLQIDAFTRHYSEAQKLDNDYDKYNTFFSELSSKFPSVIPYRCARLRIVLHPQIKIYGFVASLRDKINKSKGQDRKMVLHVGVFDKRDSLKGHSALLIFDILNQVQYYYDPLAYVGDNSKINAHMAVTPLVDGFTCQVIMAPTTDRCIQRLVEPSCLHNTTCGLVCVLVSLCFIYSGREFFEVVDALARTCATHPTYIQSFMLRFAAYYNEKVESYGVV